MDRNRLLNAFFQNNSLNALTREVSEMLQCPVIITDGTFHIVSAYSALEYNDSMYKKAIMHSELSIETCGEIAKQIENRTDSHFWVESCGNSFCVGILMSAGIFMGYVLYFLKQTEESGTDTDGLILCESLLAKQLYIERHCNDTAENNAEEILEDLLEDKYESEELFDMHISGTYLAHFSPKRMVQISFSEHENSEAVCLHLLSELENGYHASHPFFYKNSIIMFLHEDHDFRLFYSLSEEYKLVTVISDVLENLYSIKNHYRTMRDIAEYIFSEKINNGIFFETDYALLIALKRMNADNFLIDAQVKAMMNHDRENGSELCLTLYIYLSCSHSLKRTSEILFTHSNTVFYRIQKAREDFGIKTDDDKLHLSYMLSLARALLELGHAELFITKKSCPCL